MANWQEYERLKQLWISKHPNATSDEYTLAMRLIAKKCGV